MRIVVVVAVVLSLLVCPLGCFGAFDTCANDSREAGCHCCQPVTHGDGVPDSPPESGGSGNCICKGALPGAADSAVPELEKVGSFFSPPLPPLPVTVRRISRMSRFDTDQRVLHGPGARSLRIEMQSLLF